MSSTVIREEELFDGRQSSPCGLAHIQMVCAQDFMAALAKKPEALAFFESLTKVNRYAIYHRLHTAKRPETRAKRMKDFLAMLERGEKSH